MDTIRKVILSTRFDPMEKLILIALITKADQDELIKIDNLTLSRITGFNAGLCSIVQRRLKKRRVFGWKFVVRSEDYCALYWRGVHQRHGRRLAHLQQHALTSPKSQQRLVSNYPVEIEQRRAMVRMDLHFGIIRSLLAVNQPWLA